MSRLSLDAASGFFSVELVTSAIVPCAGEAGQALSFDRYLQQATAAAPQTTETDRPPLPTAPPAAEDDATRPLDPANSYEDRSAATEPTSGSDRQGGPSGPPSEADPQPRVPDPEAVSDEPTEPNEEEEDEDEQSAADSARPVAALDVEALVEAGNPESSQGDSAASAAADVTHESQGEASHATQQRLTPATTGEMPPGDSEESGSIDTQKSGSIDTQKSASIDTEKSGSIDTEKSGSVDTEKSGSVDTEKSASIDTQKSASIDTQTEAADKSSAQRNGNAVEAVQAQKGETADDGSARPSVGSSGAVPNADDAAPETSNAAGLGTADASSQGEASPAGSRRRERSSRVGDRPGDRPTAEQGAPTESGQTPQDPKMATPVEAPNGPESDGGEAVTSGPISAETSEGEAGPPTRAWASQGTQPASTARGPEPSGPDQAGRVRFVQRVARAFETMGGRGGSVRLRLHPPELGSLRLEVAVRNGTMTARLEVESDSARTMLLDNLPALRDRLAQQGIKVDRFDVDLGDRSAGGTPQGPGDHPPPQDHPELGSPNPRSEQEIEGERPPEPRAAVPPDQGNQLDVVV